jgi:arylsulfatase A-like enzyme/Flp pilus assembly protein TadD
MLWRGGRALVIVLAGLAVNGCARGPRTGVPAAPNANILLVTVDTLRADRIGGGVTPEIDGIAASGVRFTNARANAPLTLPSHATIMTGALPPAHGVRQNGTDRLAGGRPTLARLLKARGYRTGAFVGAFVLDGSFGLGDGFDVYDDRIRRDPDTAMRLEAERPASEVVDAALGWLASPGAAGQPFFLWAHLYDPHAPYAPPADFARRAGGRLYEGEIAYADAQLGRLARAARKQAGGAPLIVAVAGDHGESLGEHGEPTHGMLVYDASLRVPIVVACHRGDQDVTIGDALDSRAVSLQDLAPTLLALVGAPAPNEMTGAPLLGGAGTRRGDSYAESVYPRAAGWSPVRSLTDGRWKLIVSSRVELYDLNADPGETTDVTAAQDSVAKVMRARLDALWRPAGPGAPISAEAAERLRALGYVAASADPGPLDSAPNPADQIASWTEFERASANLLAGRPWEAVGPLRRLAARHADAPVFQSTYARALKETGRAREALARYRATAARWPQDAVLLHDLAVAARDAGAADEALKAELAAAALDPKFASPHNGMGLIHTDAGRPSEAAAAFARAAELDPRNVSAWNNLGNARRATDDAAGARQAYESALRIDPNDPDAANGLGVLLVQDGRPTEAVAYFERALTRAPAMYQARLNLGIALQESGQPGQAAEAYRRVLADAPRGSKERDAASTLLRKIK